MAASDERTHRPDIARLESLPLELIQRIMATLPAAERARMALTCRHMAAAAAGSHASGSAATSTCWREATLMLLGESKDNWASLMTWAANHSMDIQRLRISTPITVNLGDCGHDMTHMLLCLLHAVRTLRIDCFYGAMGPVVCTTVLNSMARRSNTAQLLHLALHGLYLPPGDPQLVAAVQGQSELEELVLSFNPGVASISYVTGATVVSAACACRKLQRLSVIMQPPGGMKLRSLPSNLATLASLASLDLRYCNMEGALQLPPNLVNLRLDDCFPHELPASLGAMTALTRMESTSTAGPPPAWPPRLQILKLDCEHWGDDGDGLLGPRLASLAAVSELRFLHLSSCGTIRTCIRQLDLGTATLPALEGLGIVHCGLTTVPPLKCLSRLTSLDVSRNCFAEVPRVLLAVTAYESLDMSGSFDQPGSLNVSSLVVFFNLAALKRLNLKPGTVRGPYWLPAPAPQTPEQKELLRAISEMMEVRKPPATVAIRDTDQFPEMVPPVSPWATDRGWQQ